MICLGLDWAEDHHDVTVMDQAGAVLAERRVGDTMEGVVLIHELVGEHEADPSQVMVGTESVHGLVPQALIAAGYVVYEINPLAASRYRDRHHLSGAKSDRADAKTLADVVRTDRHNHRQYAGDSDLAEGIKVLARTHHKLTHDRQTQINQLRSLLRNYFPALLLAFPLFATPSERGSRDAMAMLERAPTPARARALTTAQIAAVLRQAGRKRGIEQRAKEIRDALRAPQLEAPPIVTDASGSSAQGIAVIVRAMTAQIDRLNTDLNARFEEHPDAKIILSLPGLGPVLGARVLAEFGDAPNRYVDARARKNYATTSPVTRASGKLRVVAVRHGGNRRLGESLLRCALSAAGCQRLDIAAVAEHEVVGQCPPIRVQRSRGKPEIGLYLQPGHGIWLFRQALTPWPVTGPVSFNDVTAPPRRTGAAHVPLSLPRHPALSVVPNSPFHVT